MCKTYKKIMFIINPNAGREGYKAATGEILKVFSHAGYLPTVFVTKYRGHVPEMIAHHGADYDLIVCMGGDGTLSETVSGIMSTGLTTPIGYIPLGTANDVAKTLGLPAKPVEAAKRIVSGNPFPMDVGKFGPDTYFSYIAGFGAFTEVSYGTPSEYKHALGPLAYILEGMRHLPKLTSYKAIIEHDGGVLSDDFVFGAVTNSTSVAGLVKLKEDSVNLSDGMFELLLVRKPQNLIDLNEILSEILLSNFSDEHVIMLKSREVRIMLDRPVPWTRDGEDGGQHRDVCIFNLHSAVNIIV